MKSMTNDHVKTMKIPVPGHEHTHAQNRFAVIPIAERLDATASLAGRGITIAVLDSGFYPHPDLTRPRNRILYYHDVTDPHAKLDSNQEPQAWQWHGTQTSVTAAGNGYLSDGIYKGLAYESSIVLVKVSDRGRISDENIIRGLEWVITNKQRFNIRIVSMSLGGDIDASFSESRVDEAAERAVQAGLTLVVAAGNAGCTAEHKPIPPANSPSVITVGGYNDNNELDRQQIDSYCSSYGPTIDGLIKPEIIAPAIWVAAPILPETAFYRNAEALSVIAATPDYRIKKLAVELWRDTGLPQEITTLAPEQIREAAEAMLLENKVVSTHYQHVDGTSFATPVVASVIAQMLEANPNLTPGVIKNILASTADRSAGLPLLQQGYGLLNVKRAVEQAAHENHTHKDCDFNAPRIANGKLIFWYHNDDAQDVSLAGDFNNWIPQNTRLDRHSSGLWYAEIDPPTPGSYQYKYVVNGDTWIDDPGNGLKIADNYGGFNSIINIAE